MRALLRISLNDIYIRTYISISNGNNYSLMNLLHFGSEMYLTIYM